MVYGLIGVLVGICVGAVLMGLVLGALRRGRLALPRTDAELTGALLIWGKRVVPCSCHGAYRGRGLVDPDCPWHGGAEVVLRALVTSEEWSLVYRGVESEHVM